MTPKPTIWLLGRPAPLAATIAEQLADHNADVCMAPSAVEMTSWTGSVFPDVVVATSDISDADLLKTGRRLRDQLTTQHVALLVLATPDDTLCRSASDGPADDTGGLLARQISVWLDCMAEIRDRRDRVAVNGLVIDRRRFSARLHDRELPLTPTEFRLLWTLARSPGHVFSRVELAAACQQHDLPAQPRTIDVHIKSIRQKLRPHDHLIETLRGLGYRVTASGSPETNLP